MTKRATLNSRGKLGAATEPFVTTESQDTAKKEAFRSNLSRARYNKSIGKIADNAFATKDHRVKAAYDEAKMRLTNASKSEFQQALALAENHVPSSKPQTQDDRDAVKKLVEKLQKLLRGRRLGRALSEKPKEPMSVRAARHREPLAEFAAADLVRAAKHLWCKENKRQRVPPEETEKMIAAAVARISLQMSVPESKIRRDAISRLLNKK